MLPAARHIHQRIPVADFVEMHIVQRHVVDRGLGLRQVAQDGRGVRSGAGVQRRGLDPRHHVAEAGARTGIKRKMLMHG